MLSRSELESFVCNVFQGIGCSPEDAEGAAKVLVSADARGIESHGVARLSGYIRLWEAKRINPTPNVQIVHETPSTAVIDGDGGLGLVVGPKAMQKVLELAAKAGTGWVAVRNSNHYGIAGYHAMLALEADMIGISTTNASPLVAPTFGAERLLGTNPIAVAVPADQEPPFVADMATTTAANGKLEVLMRKNQQAPLGWLQDKDGQPSTNAFGVKEGGALLPLGGSREMGSHKGYALGGLVDILSGVLSGANFGPWVPPFVSYSEPSDDPVGEGLGHFFGAMRVDAFGEAAAFKKRMDTWIRRFRSSKVVEGQERVLIPGDPEREMEMYTDKHGITLGPGVADELVALGKRFGADWPG